MPNWTKNYVKIEGDKKVLEEIKALMSHTEKDGTLDEFCFENSYQCQKNSVSYRAVAKNNS